MDIYIKKINSNIPLVRKEKTYAYLLSALKKYYNCNIDLKDILITKDNKPYIKDNPIYFNISYADKYAVIGISYHNVGIDIEKVQKADDNIINKVFTAQEKQFLDESTNKDYNFTKLWTQKEAYVKYIGTGINSSFYNLECSDIIKKNNTMTFAHKNYIISAFYEDETVMVKVC